jgi:riboflavin kinase / FMN adenylyltransferase
VKIFRQFKESKDRCVATIGNFDGIHLGHQKIINKINDISKNNNLKRVLITFEPHPYKVIKPNNPAPKKINSLKQKLNFLKQNNLFDEVYLIKFNNNLKNIEARDFIKDFLVKKLKLKSILVGYDFTFGKNKKGNFTLLKSLGDEFDFTVEDIKAHLINGEIISSTKIRQYISQGMVEKCADNLGRNYQITGRVVKGKKLARDLGFPTANIKISDSLQKLKYGVYEAVVTIDNKKLKSIVNYGIKPTFSGKCCLCEVHIFNFNKNIYGKILKVEFLRFIRTERKFSSIDQLRKAIKEDCNNISKNYYKK